MFASSPLPSFPFRLLAVERDRSNGNDFRGVSAVVVAFVVGIACRSKQDDDNEEVAVNKQRYATLFPGKNSLCLGALFSNGRIVAEKRIIRSDSERTARYGSVCCRPLLSVTVVDVVVVDVIVFVTVDVGAGGIAVEGICWLFWCNCLCLGVNIMVREDSMMSNACSLLVWQGRDSDED